MKAFSFLAAAISAELLDEHLTYPAVIDGKVEKCGAHKPDYKKRCGVSFLRTMKSLRAYQILLFSKVFKFCVQILLVSVVSQLLNTQFRNGGRLQLANQTKLATVPMIVTTVV